MFSLLRPKRLSIKIFLLIAAVLIVGVVGHSIVSLHLHEKHTMRRMIASADRISEVIRRSIYHGMLENDKESIQRTLGTIGQSRDVKVVRIYNKQGTIIVSTNAGEKGTQVNMAAEACDGCHIEDQPLPLRSEGTYSRIYRSSDDTRQLGIISPIKNEPNCINALCHAHPATNTVLGVLDVQMSMSAADASIADEQRQQIITSIILILLVAGMAGLFLWNTVHKPVRTLIHGTEEVATGNLRHRINLAKKDEFGGLASSFNSMMTSLETAQNKLKEWADTLEEQVEKKTEDLEQIQRQMLQIEKITSLGRLSTTVAHELNNPLASILNYTKLLLRDLDKMDLPEPDRKSIEKDVQFIRDESKRCGEIVKNMLLFARRSGGAFESIRARDIVEKSLMLVAHKMEIQNIEMNLIMKTEDDVFTGDPAQLQQAFVALLINAVEAMPDGGILSFEVRREPESPSLEFFIGDSGIGIPAEQLDQIFEPFYTTKTDGKSLGLGLSVVYGIIHRHHGTIKVISEEGQGTRFTITLPREQSLEAEAEESLVFNVT